MTDTLQSEIDALRDALQKAQAQKTVFLVTTEFAGLCYVSDDRHDAERFASKSALFKICEARIVSELIGDQSASH